MNMGENVLCEVCYVSFDKDDPALGQPSNCPRQADSPLKMFKKHLVRKRRNAIDPMQIWLPLYYSFVRI